MSISPPTDIVLDVARAADPARYQLAAARLGGTAATAGAAFETTLAAETPKTAPTRLATPPAPATNIDTMAARKTPATPAAKADTDFEAMVLANLLEAAMPDDGSAVFGQGTAGSVWKSMLIEQIAGQMAKAGGIGIAEQLARGSQTALLGGDKSDARATRDATKALLIDKVQRGFVQGAQDNGRMLEVGL